MACGASEARQREDGCVEGKHDGLGCVVASRETLKKCACRSRKAFSYLFLLFPGRRNCPRVPCANPRSPAHTTTINHRTSGTHTRTHEHRTRTEGLAELDAIAERAGGSSSSSSSSKNASSRLYEVGYPGRTSFFFSLALYLSEKDSLPTHTPQ